METITETATHNSSDTFTIRSSISRDVWHDDCNPAAYEWWYFDAVSDDGRDVLVIIFLTNFIFSPRYNRTAEFISHQSSFEYLTAPRFPAVVCCLYRDGRPLLRAINEYPSSEFEARTDTPACRIGDSKFTLNTSSNDPSYDLTIDEPLRGARRLRADFSWRMCDGDFDASHLNDSRLKDSPPAATNRTHEWNMVAPRCHVTGAMRVEQLNRQTVTQYQFNGCGYHDHNRDTRPLSSTVKSWQWGRAHFADDITAIFYQYYGTRDDSPVTKLLLVRDGKLEIQSSKIITRNTRRNVFGVQYPREMTFATNENISLHISQRRVIDQSFFYIRALSEAILKIPNCQTHQTHAVTEHLAPRALKFRWLDWLVNMRIGRNGRTAFLP